jgi:hypothetical protein
MSVKIEAVQIGSVFEFPGGPRRVVGLHPPVGHGFGVIWEYADGKKRAGRLGGEQWVHYFRRQAIREIPDRWRTEVGYVELQGSGRKVPACREPVSITLSTKAPAKWAFVDQESGEIWTHDGQDFRRMTPEEMRELAELVGRRAMDSHEDQMELVL